MPLLAPVISATRASHINSSFHFLPYLPDSEVIRNNVPPILYGTMFRLQAHCDGEAAHARERRSASLEAGRRPAQDGFTPQGGYGGICRIGRGCTGARNRGPRGRWTWHGVSAFRQRSDLIVAVFQSNVDSCADAAPALAKEHPPTTALSPRMERYVDFIAIKRGLCKALYSGDSAYRALPEYSVNDCVRRCRRCLMHRSRQKICVRGLTRTICCLLWRTFATPDTGETRTMRVV